MICVEAELSAQPLTNKSTMKNYTNEQLVRKIIKIAKKRGLRPYRAYSGRGMFGRTCIGFYGENAECAALACLIRRKTGKSFSYDNLALDVIYYFPCVEDKR